MINTSENRSPFGPILEGHTDCHSEQISDFPSDQVLDDLHKKFVEYGANAKLWKRKCTLLLPEIQKHKIWEKKNFSSIYEYAAKLAGLSRETVDDGLRILKKIENKPALRQVVEEKGINAVRPVLGVATAENEKFWAQKSRTMSKNTLETYVRESKISGTANVPQNLWRTSTPQRVTLEMELDPEIADQLKKLKGREDWNILMKQLLEMRKKELEAKKPSR